MRFVLTRQFLGNLTGRGILNEDGIEGLQRVLISAFAGLVSLGLYLPRRYFMKYGFLHARSGPEVYQQEVLADGLFIITLCITLAGLVAALVAPAIFPDETDYLTLTPLPLKRRRIFGAKLLALAVFTGTFVLALTAVFSMTFPLFTHGRWAQDPRWHRMLSLAIASASGAAFAFVCIAALQGLTLLMSPHRWVAQTTTVLQSLLVAGVMLLTPVAVRLSAQPVWLSGHPAELRWVPTAWFLGLEQVLLGNPDPYFMNLARIGGVVSVSAVAISALCYSLFYLRFERVMLTNSTTVARPGASLAISSKQGGRAKPAAAVWSFVLLTLRRSRLSQLLVVMTWSAGCAFASYGLLNSVLGQSFRSGEAFPQPFLDAAITMPFVMTLFGIIGLRAAFLLPVNSRANWIFRMTDDPRTRRGHLDAVDRVLISFAIVPALAVAAPIQWSALSPSVTIMALLLAGAFGALLIEAVLLRWRRIPFTCTWLPGKRPLPLTLMAVALGFWLFLFVGNLSAFALFHPSRFLVFFGLLIGAAAWARRRRLRTWASNPLEFEDEPYDSLQSLDLFRN